MYVKLVMKKLLSSLQPDVQMVLKKMAMESGKATNSAVCGNWEEINGRNDERVHK